MWRTIRAVLICLALGGCATTSSMMPSLSSMSGGSEPPKPAPAVQPAVQGDSGSGLGGIWKNFSSTFSSGAQPASQRPFTQGFDEFNLNIMKNNKIKTIKGAQALVKNFALRNHWKDLPNVDKFDHLHEELLEMSKYLRYKTEKERIKTIKEKKEIFVDGIGDLFFGTCRLANQLGVDIEEAFNMVQKEILAKYNHKKAENKLIRK